jgi:hypothetical protein
VGANGSLDPIESVRTIPDHIGIANPDDFEPSRGQELVLLAIVVSAARKVVRSPVHLHH